MVKVLWILIGVVIVLGLSLIYLMGVVVKIVVVFVFDDELE